MSIIQKLEKTIYKVGIKFLFAHTPFEHSIYIFILTIIKSVTEYILGKTMAEKNLGFWLLTFDYFKKDIKKPEDNVIVLVHWLLLKNNFQVLGPGIENEIAENEQPTDVLPENWSQNVTSYYMRYTRNKTLFLLNGIKAGDNSIIFNFYNVTTKHVSSAAIGDISTTIQYMNDIKNNEDDFFKIINLLQKDLINPMQEKNDDQNTVGTQTESEHKSSYSVWDLQYHPISLSRTESDIFSPPRNPDPSYGVGDLNPLGGLQGGGMVFDPMRVRDSRTRRMPRVPPSARFDPILPQNPDPMMPGSLGRPNPDHMRPPDFDDMYM